MDSGTENPVTSPGKKINKGFSYIHHPWSQRARMHGLNLHTDSFFADIKPLKLVNISLRLRTVVCEDQALISIKRHFMHS